MSDPAWLQTVLDRAAASGSSATPQQLLSLVPSILEWEQPKELDDLLQMLAEAHFKEDVAAAMASGMSEAQARQLAAVKAGLPLDDSSSVSRLIRRMASLSPRALLTDDLWPKDIVTGEPLLPSGASLNNKAHSKQHTSASEAEAGLQSNSSDSTSLASRLAHMQPVRVEEQKDDQQEVRIINMQAERGEEWTTARLHLRTVVSCSPLNCSPSKPLLPLSSCSLSQSGSEHAAQPRESLSELAPGVNWPRLDKLMHRLLNAPPNHPMAVQLACTRLMLAHIDGIGAARGEWSQLMASVIARRERFESDPLFISLVQQFDALQEEVFARRDAWREAEARVSAEEARRAPIQAQLQQMQAELAEEQAKQDERLAQLQQVKADREEIQKAQRDMRRKIQELDKQIQQVRDCC